MRGPGAQVRVVCFLSLLAGCRAPTIEQVAISFDAGTSARSTPARSDQVLRFSVAAIQSPARSYTRYAQLLRQIGDSMGVGIEIIHRRSYRETNDLLVSGQLDAAFICTGGYAELLRRNAKVEIVAVPVVGGAMTYHSLIIVASGSPATRFEDLAGKRFAFTDELSLSGHAWPKHLARSRGLDPPRFFSQAYFTRSHDRSIEAVARGFVSGAAVDSNIYADLIARDPGLATRVRVLLRSPPFGIPPLVASTALPADVRSRLRAMVLSLGDDPAGAAELRELRIDRFEIAPPDLYDSAFAMIREAE